MRKASHGRCPTVLQILAVFCLAVMAAHAAGGEVSTAPGSASAEAAASAGGYPPEDATVLARDSGTPADKASVGKDGHFVFLECPKGKWYLVAVDFYGAREGIQEPPVGQWRISVCGLNFKTAWTIEKPYSLLKRGEEKWHRIPVPPVELPGGETSARQAFWLNLAFDNSQIRTVNMGHDAPKAANNSRVGLPDGKAQQNTAQKYDWMIRAVISEQPGTPAADLGVWLSGLIELRYDGDKVDGALSKEGLGPAMHFQNVPRDSILEGFSVYARKSGTGYDPARTMVSYWVVDDSGTAILSGSVRYSNFPDEARWTDIEVKKTPVPTSFWVVINPRSDARKSVDFYYSARLRGASHSKWGSGPGAYRDIGEKMDWMLRAYVRRQSGTAGEAAAAPPQVE